MSVQHWHLVVWPERDGYLSRFMQELTIMHVRNWQENRQRVGYGHLYQGRYKSFPVESDEHFYQVTRYVERNALCANLVSRAEELSGTPEMGTRSGAAEKSGTPEPGTEETKTRDDKKNGMAPSAL